LQLKKGIPNFALPKGTIPHTQTGVAKLVDVPDLGSGAVRHGGSSPFARTFYYIKALLTNMVLRAFLVLDYKKI
jgi:hypothetical protein